MKILDMGTNGISAVVKRFKGQEGKRSEANSRACTAEAVGWAFSS